ncbi:Sfum_1244 family protein, partial [Kaarinaea lacus]
DSPMARALACYGYEQKHQHHMESILDQMTDNELESVLLHETGEAQAKSMLGSEWEDLLTCLPRSKAEFIARAVRDNLADCLTTLPALIETGNEASLHFYFANFSGMRKELFPEALGAYQNWIVSGNFNALINVCRNGQDRWQNLANRILELYKNHTHSLAEDIESLCQLDI